MTRQTNVIVVWADGRGSCLLPRCDKTVRRQLKRLHGQSAWNMAESCHDNKSAVLMRAGARGTWRGKSACVCVICHENRCLWCLSFWCRPTSNCFPWWLVTRVWHVPTKCLAAGGQARRLLLAGVRRLLGLFPYKKVGSKVSTAISLFFFQLLESIWNFPGVISALTRSQSINKQKVGTVVLHSSVQITVETHLSGATGNRRC